MKPKGELSDVMLSGLAEWGELWKSILINEAVPANAPQSLRRSMRTLYLQGYKEGAEYLLIKATEEVLEEVGEDLSKLNKTIANMGKHNKPAKRKQKRH